MSREVRRVPLDFEWPLNKTWEGYLLPERLRAAPCPAGASCVNGATPAMAWVSHIARLALMLDEDLDAQRRDRPMHLYFGDERFHGPRPSPDISEFAAGLAGRGKSFLGHDSINAWTATRKLVEAAGLDPETWGRCPECGGEGVVDAYEGQAAERDAWEPTLPPTGDGWQLWSTVSEGSPVSPVFATAEELAQWLTTILGGEAAGPSRQPMTIEQAREFVKAGWSPSFIGNAGGLHDGASYIGSEEVLRQHEADLGGGELRSGVTKVALTAMPNIVLWTDDAELFAAWSGEEKPTADWIGDAADLVESARKIIDYRREHPNQPRAMLVLALADTVVSGLDYVREHGLAVEVGIKDLNGDTDGCE